ncbi:putative disease resistance protein RGA3 [Chenopodium quinoa]|uniref:putative disease resistance protein RGA3 n=1 Tax=Chenopodium quinoa TaxID=63459 RepID=UPI000B78AE01|nr:putative disease resistance protein RGA3 [Chenopodium quinoa]
MSLADMLDSVGLLMEGHLYASSSSQKASGSKDVDSSESDCWTVSSLPMSSDSSKMSSLGVLDGLINESELEKLLETVKTIKNFLLDADSKCQKLTNEGQYWVQNLKDAVYDADDLMNEFNTIAHQLKRMPGGKILKKVRRFFSSNNQLIFAVNKSKEIKNLREKLDRLAKNHSDFGFSELYKPVKIREETCLYVYEQDIIGRDADKEAIVDMLLKDDVLENNISFVTIVGIGGLGKTALAQLVFSDHRIKEAFQENMYWVCVSLNFDTKDILGKMIGRNELGFEDLHKVVRNKIEGKRFLLVLDDVWYENGRKWDELKNFLILGGRGSRILVTSRSRKVARAIGNYPIHELPGLSAVDSWELFKKISVGDREDEAVTGLVEIGRDIVKKCANVPLSIRVVASLLRFQDIATWQSFKSNQLANMCAGEDSIMPTLMFSYYHLTPELKSCFSFCSLFPEDYVIDKTLLIFLWMAQGYLVPSAKNESMEDVGEKYISILLHRCFFQDIRRDNIGEVYSFKMHDLMHELARNVAAKESLTLTACTNDFEGKVRHLYIDCNEGLTTWFHSSNCSTKTLRTFLKYSVSTTSDVDAIISNCSRLGMDY